VLEHQCEEHGTHQHILSQWIEVDCEHEHHQEEEQHFTKVSDSSTTDFEATQASEALSFVYFYAERLVKTSSVLPFATSPLQIVLLPTFDFQWLGSFSTTDTFLSSPPPFRRPFGRLLLTWVQSFLI